MKVIKLPDDTTAGNIKDVGFVNDSQTILKAQPIKGINGKADALTSKYSAVWETLCRE